MQVQYSYDELARLTMESAAITASTPAAAASFGYDAAGRMTSFSARGGDVNLAYDDRGLLLSVSGPNTPSSFEYDALGRMTKRTDATGESLYQWDTDGRLVADTEALLSDPASGVSAVQWRFATSPVTGVGGPSGPLADALTKAGILWVAP